MSEEKHSDNSFDGDSREPFDDVDEELVNLSGPPPDLRLALFSIAILALSCFMLVWFFPEAKYLASAFREPTNLGEAADIDMTRLENHSYVSVDGFPLIQRTLMFKEGVKWFTLSDNTRKFFPLAGQPNLYVQWAETDAHKAYRDPETQPGALGPPAHFEGHLLKRADLGENFERIWVFYDCLKHHYLGRCNYCLGRSTMEECRNAFTCRENNDAETCGKMLERSEGPLESEIAALEKSASNKETKAKLADLKALRIALREHRIAVTSVKLEELASKARRLHHLSQDQNSDYQKTLDKIRGDVLTMRIDELEIRATHAMKTLNALSDTDKKEIEGELANLDALKASLETYTEELRKIKAFVQIGEALDKLRTRASAIKSKAALLSFKELETLSGWDPNTRNGKALLLAVDRLEAALAPVESARGTSPKTKDAGTADPDAGVPGKEVSTPEVPEEVRSNPSYQTLQKKLDILIQRVESVLEKLNLIGPGDKPEIEKLAMKPDVLGNVPEALREEDVVTSIPKLESLLADVEPPAEGEPPSLVRRLNDGIDHMESLKKRIEKIENRAGARETQVQAGLKDLRKSLSAALSVRSADAIDRQIDQLLQTMIINKLYLSQLKGSPKEMARLEKTMPKGAIEKLETRLEVVASSLENDDWVIIDREIPLDKLWVVLVYAILIAMIAVNLRKLWRFWLAFRD